MDSRLKTSLSILLAPKDLKLPDGNILTNQHRKIVANDLLDYLIRTNSFAKEIITPISYLLLNAEIIDSGLEKDFFLNLAFAPVRHRVMAWCVG